MNPRQRIGRPLYHPPLVSLDVAGERVEVPTRLGANLEWREQLAREAEEDREVRARETARATTPTIDGFRYWTLAYAWTYVQFEHGAGAVSGESSHVPFLLWPCQTDLAARVLEAVDDGCAAGLVVEKSRDMGATWTILATLHWLWQYRRNCNFLELSRKEELVDHGPDPKSLFWKHRYLIRRQPPWLVPRWKSAHRRMENIDMGSTIVGDTTTGEVGHGWRGTAAFLDEAARMDGFREIWEGLADATKCRIATSTAHGPGGFADLCRQPRVARMPQMFWDHPEKGLGRRMVVEAGKRRITSDWAEERIKISSRREIAENLYCDHLGAGYAWFDSDVLATMEAAHARPPLYIGEIRYTAPRGVDRLTARDAAIIQRREDCFDFRDDERGKLLLWCEIVQDRRGDWRPDQRRSYALGADIGGGVGASNSVISVGDVEAREKIGELAVADTGPEEFARIMLMLALWFGGASTPYLCWEANGAGGQLFGRHIVKVLKWPVYYSHRDETKRADEHTERFGWVSNRERKRDRLAELRADMARGEFVNPSLAAIEEARSYVLYDDGAVGPASLTEEPGSARAVHGDRVIADAMLDLAFRYASRTTARDRRPPPGSPAWEEMMEARERRMQSE